jgi:Ca2+-binding EF-hand superfamily protein
LFREVDTNGDGLISKDELKSMIQSILFFAFNVTAALKKNGYGHSEETLNNIFASLDLDASGDIDANEWKVYCFLCIAFI